MTEQELLEITEKLEASIKDLKDSRVINREPNALPLSIEGIGSEGELAFLFSEGLDRLVGNLFDLASSGNFDFITKNVGRIESTISRYFTGSGAFEGEISKAVVGTIMASVQSPKFKSMKSKIGKVRYVIKALKRERELFKDDPEQLKKLNDAIYAIGKIIKFAYKVYKNRAIINRRVLKGLDNIVVEEEEKIILEKLVEEE